MSKFHRYRADGSRPMSNSGSAGEDSPDHELAGAANSSAKSPRVVTFEDHEALLDY